MQRSFACITLAAMAVAQQQVSFKLKPKLDGEFIDMYMHQTEWSDMSV